LAFFDHILFSAANGYAAQPAVRYWTEGASEYRTAGNFPIPGNEPLKLYLGTNGVDAAMHRLGDNGGETGSNSWAAVPISATKVPGFDEVANEMLSYELTIDAEMELAGPITANLRFSCNEIDSHLVARLGHIDT